MKISLDSPLTNCFRDRRMRKVIVCQANCLNFTEKRISHVISDIYSYVTISMLKEIVTFL
jgi:hypothetical protein